MIKSQTPQSHNPQRVAIHKANECDAPAIAALANELSTYEGTTTLVDTATIVELIHSNEQPQCHIICAKMADETVAMAIYYAGYDLSSTSYGFHIADICVHEPYRHQGIGRMLIRHIADHATQENREWLSLTVLHENKIAQRFYNKLGFVNVPVQFRAAGKTAFLTL